MPIPSLDRLGDVLAAQPEPPAIRVGNEDVQPLVYAARCMNDVAASLDSISARSEKGASWESAAHLRNRVVGELRSIARGLSKNAERVLSAPTPSAMPEPTDDKVPAAPSATAAPTLRAPVHAEIDGEGFVRTGPVPGRPFQMAMWGLKH